MEIALTITEPDSPAGFELVRTHLYDYNVARTGIGDGRLLEVAAHAGAALVGAALGHTWGGTCEISLVWIDAPQRGAGLGRRLMEAVEGEALTRLCGQIVLSTHSFQAPRFYEKLGFERMFELCDYPVGHSQIFLRKQLRAAA